MTIASILNAIPKLAQEWATEREDRQQRLEADPADFKRRQDLGVPLLAVPVEFGGTWESLAQSARPICSMLRALGYLRPPWTLAFEQLFDMSWKDETKDDS